METSEPGFGLYMDCFTFGNRGYVAENLDASVESTVLRELEIRMV
jgi:hypothetical protein